MNTFTTSLPENPVLKPPITITQQLELLQSRGMLIDDHPLAAAYLQENHYYHLNIYFHKFMQPNCDIFIPGTNFIDIINANTNDSWLRKELSLLLELLEIKLRSYLAYYLAIEYGSDVFYDRSVFNTKNYYERLFKSISNDLQKRRNDPVVLHHKKKYAGKFPIWVIVEFFSFNQTSKLFSSLKTTDQKNIAFSYFNGLNEDFLGNWFHALSVLRNICAHFGYLYKRKHNPRPRLMPDFKWDKDKNDELFSYVLILHRISENTIREKFINNLSKRTSQNPSFSLDNYGFPTDWQDFLTK
jgi:abortive infection bacteriophage resistance protein